MKQLLAAVCVLVCAACGSSSSPTAPSAPPPVQTTPARLVLNAGSRADQQLDVTAHVLTADGHAVASIPVTFAITAGTLSASTVLSDGNGLAVTTASTPAPATVSASMSGFSVSMSVLASQAPVTAPIPPVLTPPAPPPPTPPAPPAPTLSASIGCTPQTPPALTPCNVSASFNGQLPSASITAVDWDFGDGTPIQHGITATHAYANVGTYPVFATVTANTSAGAQMATAVQSISVK